MTTNEVPADRSSHGQAKCRLLYLRGVAGELARRTRRSLKEESRGISRIDWVIGGCHLLGGIGEEFDSTQPFAGKRIGTGIHLEPKTVALLLALRRGGAEVISTGNLGPPRWRPSTT